MKPREPDPDDLLIGPDQWIEFIDLTGRFDRALSIDHLLTPVMNLFNRIESDCDVECCGINAYNFLPESITAAQKHLQDSTLVPNLINARDQIQNLPTDVVSSIQLNQNIDKSVFLKLLDHLIETLQQPPASPPEPSPGQSGIS